MRRTKRLGALLIALVMIFTMLPITTAGAATTSGNIVLTMNSTTFTVNGTSTKIDAEGSKPVQTNGYTMLPLRAIVEATGGTLTWTASNNSITIVRGGDTVVLTLGSKTAKVNGANRTLGAAPYATNGRTMVHIRTLELLGMRVDWEQKTNKVTVTYVDPSKVYNLTLQNSMGIAYTGVYIAPQGTAAGAAGESGNLLGADTLNINGNLVVQAPLTGTGLYQLRCTYVSQGKTISNTINNVNLTGITDRATILMNSTTSPSVTVDGATTGNTAITLYFVNKTGQNITAIYAKQSSAAYYDNTNLLGTSTLVSGGQLGVSFSYNKANPYYDFYALYANGGYEVYQRASIGVIGAQTFQTLTLGTNGSLSGAASGSGDTEVTFKNNSGSTIYEIRVGTSSSKVKSGTVVWSDSSGLKNGKSVTFDMDLGSTTKWYFGYYTSKNPSSSKSPTESGMVNFKKTSATSATVTVTEDEYELMDYDECDKCDIDSDSTDAEIDAAKKLHDDLKDKYGSSLDEDEYDDLSSSEKKHYEAGGVSFEISKIKYDGSSTSSSSGDGDTDVNLLNTHSKAIDAIYVVSKSDYNESKWDEDDYADEYDNLLDGDLDSDEYVLIEDMLEADTTNYIVWVVGSSVGKKSIKVDEDADWVSMNITSKSAATLYDSEDDKVLVFVENDSGKDDVDITIYAKDKTSTKYTIDDLDDEDYAVVWVDIGTYDDWVIEVDISGFDDETIDLTDYDGFVHVVFDDDEVTDLNEIDD